MKKKLKYIRSVEAKAARFSGKLCKWAALAALSAVNAGGDINFNFCVAIAKKEQKGAARGESERQGAL